MAVEHRETEDVATWVAAAQRGDRAAFDALVSQSYLATFALARRLTANDEDARDVVQDSYLRAWKSIRKFRGDAQFSSWLYRITANCAATHMQRQRRHRHDDLADVPEVADTRPGSRVDDVAIDHSEMGRAEAALELLAPKLRMVVVLKDVYGLSHEAIAEELQISTTAAKVRLHRGRKQLRDLLDDEAGSQAHAV
jgi:RNA polymerase sigma-70 factor (ECF subfamily)